MTGKPVKCDLCDKVIGYVESYDECWSIYIGDSICEECYRK